MTALKGTRSLAHVLCYSPIFPALLIELSTHTSQVFDMYFINQNDRYIIVQYDNDDIHSTTKLAGPQRPVSLYEEKGRIIWIC